MIFLGLFKEEKLESSNNHNLEDNSEYDLLLWKEILQSDEKETIKQNRESEITTEINLLGLFDISKSYNISNNFF
jgi:hypothetical protein